MSILKFSEKDRMASKILNDGWYHFEVVKVGDAQLSSTKSSYNFPSVFRIDEGEFAGKELELFFNTKTKSASIMGQLQMLPHSMIINLAAATSGVELSEVPDELDTTALTGGKFDGFVLKTISDGVTLNIITQFAPSGKGAAAASESVPF